MPRYSKMKDLAVFTLNGEKRIGSIAGLVFDPEQKRVCWLSLDSHGAYQGRHWIPISAIKQLDEQAVVIDSEENILGRLFVPEKNYRGAEPEQIVKASRRIVQNRVVDEQGEVLGTVIDYEFTPNSFELTRLFVAPKSNATHTVRSIERSRIERIDVHDIVVRTGAKPKTASVVEHSKQSFTQKALHWARDLVSRTT